MQDISTVKTLRFQLGILPRQYGSWHYIPAKVEVFAEPPEVIVDRTLGDYTTTDISMGPYKAIFEGYTDSYAITSFDLLNAWTTDANTNSLVSIV